MTITLPADLEERLKAAARARGVDVNAYARAVLEEAARSDRERLLAEADRIRAMTPAVTQTDSADLLRRARDARHDS